MLTTWNCTADVNLRSEYPNLDIVDDADGIDLDAGDFEGFDDFDEDDAELEDLENFLTQVTKWLG